MPNIPPAPENTAPNLRPPAGDPHQAEKYVNQLIHLIKTDKVDVLKTDLGKFDPSSLQDHYRLEFKDYQVEISHNKHPNTGKDSYIILFTNIKHIQAGSSGKVILAYMYLDVNQFNLIKKAFLQQLERKNKIEEEKRLKEALLPVDEALNRLNSESNSESTKTNGEDHLSHIVSRY